MNFCLKNQNPETTDIQQCMAASCSFNTFWENKKAADKKTVSSLFIGGFSSDMVYRSDFHISVMNLDLQALYLYQDVAYFMVWLTYIYLPFWSKYTYCIMSAWVLYINYLYSTLYALNFEYSFAISVSWIQLAAVRTIEWCVWILTYTFFHLIF